MPVGCALPSGGAIGACKHTKLERVLQLADDVSFDRSAVFESAREAHFDDVAAAIRCSRADLRQRRDGAVGVVADSGGCFLITEPEAFLVESDVVHQHVFVSVDVVDTNDRDDVAVVEVSDVFAAVPAADLAVPGEVRELDAVNTQRGVADIVGTEAAGSRFLWRSFVTR